MSTTAEIIYAAIASVEPLARDESEVDYERRVKKQASDIYIMTQDRSPISQHLATLEKCKVFTAVITDVKKEKSSTRGVVTLKTRPSKENEKGVETARTDRTENDKNSEGTAMARRLVELKGHRVLLWIYLEPMGSSGRTVRVVKHVVDLGTASDDD